ncbi:MAG: hypothetical protein EOP84_18265 [Verrucomicrobiaceae bacterium]|nr:MAG: hypothetical protein EOP84_18265 [Verrucomicrobiaceae bacterium]
MTAPYPHDLVEYEVLDAPRTEFQAKLNDRAKYGWRLDQMTVVNGSIFATLIRSADYNDRKKLMESERIIQASNEEARAKADKKKPLKG